MKILHLITDHQVIERTLGVYEEVFPGCNDVLVFCEDQRPFKRLKGNYEGKIVNSGNLKQIASNYDFTGVTHIIAHYMCMTKINFIKCVPRNIHVCWEVYGYDLYNQFLEPRGYEIYYTKPQVYYSHKFLRSHSLGLFNLYANLRATMKGHKYCFKFQKDIQFKYISNRIDSIQFLCGYDADFIKEFAKREIHSYEIFNYSLNIVLGDLKDSDFSNGEDILIGNSASLSNNHLYILNFLKLIDIPQNIKLIMPLSYGGCDKYINDVENEYRNNYPGQIEILRDYIPLHEYNNIFLRLKTMILSAWRQESQGTAMMGFYLGVKVYMSEKSPLYKWFVDCGFVVFPIESISSDGFSTPLTIEEKIKNRRLVEERYNDERVKEIFKTNIK